MDNVIRPGFPQWERREKPEDLGEDDVVILLERVMAVLTGDVTPTVVQLAVLRLIQKAVIGSYQLAMGGDAAKELLRQATELAAQYVVRGHDGTEL